MNSTSERKDSVSDQIPIEVHPSPERGCVDALKLILVATWPSNEHALDALPYVFFQPMSTVRIGPPGARGATF